jgi:tetratricopeptide (TPR) repeat protein
VSDAATLRAACEAAQAAADFRELERAGRELIALGESSGNKLELAWGYNYVGVALVRRNDGRAAERAFRTAQALYDEAGDRLGVGRMLMNLGMIAIDIDVDVDLAHKLYDEGIHIIREANEPSRLAIALGNFAEICRLEGDYRQATASAEEALAIFEDLGDAAHAAWLLADLAHFQSLRGDQPAAVANLRGAFERLRAEPNPHWTALCFDVSVIIAAKLDDWDAATRLLGFCDRYRDENAVQRLQGMLPWLSIPIERLSKELPERRRNELLLEGELLTVEEAQTLAETLAA